MTYYTALWTDDYWGYTNIGSHPTLEKALASVRRKLSRSTAEAGVIFDAKPARDADESWVMKHEVGVVNVRVGDKRTSKTFPQVYFTNAYVYYPKQKYGRHNVKYLVKSDGSLTPFR